MRRAVVASLAVILGFVVTSSGADGHEMVPCSLADLRVNAILMSPPTGLAERGLRVVDRSNRPCMLVGFPVIALRDRAGQIPFSYRHTGRPSVVRLGRGQAAYVVISKFRCDMGWTRVASAGEAWFRGRPSLRVRFTPHVAFAICRPGIASEGRVVTVTPFRRTLRAAIADALSG